MHNINDRTTHILPPKCNGHNHLYNSENFYNYSNFSDNNTCYINAPFNNSDIKTPKLSQSSHKRNVINKRVKRNRFIDTLYPQNKSLYSQNKTFSEKVRLGLASDISMDALDDNDKSFIANFGESALCSNHPNINIYKSGMCEFTKSTRKFTTNALNYSSARKFTKHYTCTVYLFR